MISFVTYLCTFASDQHQMLTCHFEEQPSVPRPSDHSSSPYLHPGEKNIFENSNGYKVYVQNIITLHVIINITYTINSGVIASEIKRETT